jgi:hypothetical protein
MKHRPENLQFYNESYFYPHHRFPPIPIETGRAVMRAVSNLGVREVEHWGTCRPSLLASLSHGAGNLGRVIGIQVFKGCYFGGHENLREFYGSDEPPWSSGLPSNVVVSAYQEFSPTWHFTRAAELFVLDSRPQTMAGLDEQRLDHLLFQYPEHINADFLVLLDIDPQLSAYVAAVLPHHAGQKLTDLLYLFTRQPSDSAIDGNSQV